VTCDYCGSLDHANADCPVQADDTDPLDTDDDSDDDAAT
jgi:hypothetical protein